MLMQIANEFVTDLITGLDMTDTLQLFELSLSELNLRNLSSSLGTGG